MATLAEIRAKLQQSSQQNVVLSDSDAPFLCIDLPFEQIKNISNDARGVLGSLGYGLKLQVCRRL